MLQLETNNIYIDYQSDIFKNDLDYQGYFKLIIEKLLTK